MDNCEITSAVTGKPVEEVRKLELRISKMKDCLKTLVEETAKCSTDDCDLIANVSTNICMMIHVLSIEDKFTILNYVSLMELTGKAEELVKQSEKFVENDKKKIPRS